MFIVLSIIFESGVITESKRYTENPKVNVSVLVYMLL